MKPVLAIGRLALIAIASVLALAMAAAAFLGALGEAIAWWVSVIGAVRSLFEPSTYSGDSDDLWVAVGVLGFLGIVIVCGHLQQRGGRNRKRTPCVWELPDDEQQADTH